MESIGRKETGAMAFAAVWDSRLSTTTDYQSCKRAFDIVVSAVAFVVVLPLLAVVSALILLDLNCAPIYKQKRVGLNGEVFEIYKLRTMLPGSEDFSFKTDNNDWRVTWLGQILRSTKIDELPQLINILNGDMSIIGPRPLSVAECQHLQKSGWEANYPGFIPTMAPGLIGLEQIRRSKDMDYRQRFALNYQYEMNVSFQLELDVFIKAIWVCRPVCLAACMAGLSEAMFFMCLHG